MPLLFNGSKFVLHGTPIPVYVLQLLETLPKLSDIVIEDLTARVRLQDLHFFARIAQKTVLRHLSCSLEYESVANVQPIAGPEGLESISIKWHVTDGLDAPGSSASHLHAFLMPSLGTLTHLELYDYPILDFQVFGPPCTSLCTFKYTTCGQLEGSRVLEAVSEMFSKITNLEIVFLAHVWTVCQIVTLN
jgi:hypothetical protein